MKRILKLIAKITLYAFILITIVSTFFWFRGVKERNEALALIINDVSFSTLEDGTYYGYYTGGMHGFRENAVEITIIDGIIIKIENKINMEEKDNEFLITLYSKVIDNQSLDIDGISGSTLTSKAYLKSIENAVNNADEGE